MAIRAAKTGLLPHLPTLAELFILDGRYWARRRGIYSNIVGFFGGCLVWRCLVMSFANPPQASNNWTRTWKDHLVTIGCSDMPCAQLAEIGLPAPESCSIKFCGRSAVSLLRTESIGEQAFIAHKMWLKHFGLWQVFPIVSPMAVELDEALEFLSLKSKVSFSTGFGRGQWHFVIYWNILHLGPENVSALTIPSDGN